MKTYHLATIPGDGIGKEVVPAGQKVLEALATTGKSFGFEFESFAWGGDWRYTDPMHFELNRLVRPA